MTAPSPIRSSVDRTVEVDLDDLLTLIDLAHDRMFGNQCRCGAELFRYKGRDGFEVHRAHVIEQARRGNLRP